MTTNKNTTTTSESTPAIASSAQDAAALRVREIFAFELFCLNSRTHSNEKLTEDSLKADWRDNPQFRQTWRDVAATMISNLQNSGVKIAIHGVTGDNKLSKVLLDIVTIPASASYDLTTELKGSGTPVVQ